MLAGEEGPEREWMLEAEKLVDMFRETRNLFLTSRVCTRLIIRTTKITVENFHRQTRSVECFPEVE